MAADVGSMFQYWKKFDLRRLQEHGSPGSSEKPTEEEKSDLVALGCLVLVECYSSSQPLDLSLIQAGIQRGEGAIVVAASCSVLSAGSHPDSPGLHRTV
ncbi:homeobox protein cut-like 2 [Lates japonicus]|uniref:Homeobox protein cut-like 2 n=1 Tax=Lates japonicus TaxID=270547 RepID=A0AAD3R2E0_LATJO|nr:homeobox protein cut-like 2 [Lates japonicus]